MRRPLLLAPFLGLLAGAAFAAPPQRPFPQHATYAAGTLRPAHRSQAQQDADVVAAYGRWKSRYLARAGSTPDGQPRYRVLFSADPGAKTVSEGQGYGMVIVALLAGAEPDAQTLFDGLWAYARDHRSAIEPRLMDWQVPADEAPQPGDDNSAFDGDSDIAYALLLAHRQWGSGGRVDYRREAERVLAGMAAATLGPDSHLPLLGDWVDPAGADYNQRTVRPSDFMPGHFRSFARATGDPAWSAAVTAVQAATTALQTRFSPATGLLPDFTVPVSAADPAPKPAPPGFLEGSADGAYSYNAGRVPWRLAADALLHGDATSLAQARRISRWAEAAAGGDPRRIRAGYRLDGTALPDSDFFSSFFAAPLAVAAMLDPAQRPWLERTYDAGGRVDYRREAERVLAGMAAATLGPDSRLPLLGDWVDPGGSDYNQRTVRSSDFMPGHFRSFARATGDPVWTAAAAAVQAATTALQTRFGPATGLLPDFTVPVSASDPAPKPAPPGFLEGSADGAYSYNAGRVPWRLAADALLHGDATSRAQALRISRWAEAAAAGDPRRIRAGYRLDGTPLPDSDFFSSFFAAPLAVAAMLDPAQRPWLERTYDAVRGEVQGYYEDSVTLLCLLLLTGNAWEPEPAPAGACAPGGLCLGGRFEVAAAWQTRDGQSGQATPRTLTDDTGVFWFFAPENLELVVKVLDGCAVNGRFWVFAGGLTDVAVQLTVTDTRTGETRTYTNPQRTPFRPLQDTAAFTGCGR